MLTQQTQAQIADIVRWMDATKVPRGTEAGHARNAIRAILGLARMAGGDMGRVEEILAEHVAEAWRVTGCSQVAHTGMVPLFTEAEVPDVARTAQETRKVLV
jgi:hypothetical protein